MPLRICARWGPKGKKGQKGGHKGEKSGRRGQRFVKRFKKDGAAYFVEVAEDEDETEAASWLSEKLCEMDGEKESTGREKGEVISSN